MMANRIVAFTAAWAVGILAFAASTSPAQALLFDQNVTNNVVFGSGNANGSFTVDQRGGVELGLRGKLRFDATGQPQNIFNSNGAGTYTFDAGQAVGGFSFAQPPTTTPVWNFEWSINADYLGTSGVALDDLTYKLELDFDPGPGQTFLEFDPINLAFADHAIGDNSTGAGAGAVATNAAEYAALIAGNNLAQNSWNYEFFNDGPFAGFDPNVPGTYDIRLTASDDSGEIASTQITVEVVPEPASTVLGFIGLGAVSLVRRLRRKAGAPGNG